VEADFFLQGELRAVLEEVGLGVVVVPSVEQALPLVRDSRFSLAVLGSRSITSRDVRLAILLREGNPSIPFILHASSSDRLKESEQGPLTGASSFPKPFRVAKFRSLVVDVLGLTETDRPGTTIPYDSGREKEKGS
jgi:DNA-binding NtrC family response regulator